MDKLKHITVVAGLIYKEDKYLIGRRKPDDLGGCLLYTSDADDD